MPFILERGERTNKKKTREQRKEEGEESRERNFDGRVRQEHSVQGTVPLLPLIMALREPGFAREVYQP